MKDFELCEVFSRMDAEGTSVTIHPPLDEAELGFLRTKLEQSDGWDPAWQPETVEEPDNPRNLSTMTPHTLIRVVEGEPGYDAKNKAVGACL